MAENSVTELRIDHLYIDSAPQGCMLDALTLKATMGTELIDAVG